MLEPFDTDPSDKIQEGLLRTDEPIHVLSVEDDAVAMSFLKVQISNLGHKMISAENGKVAIDYLRKNKDDIDVVLMDREMPVMDGMTAIGHMKDDPDLRRIPVVMVTCADDLSDIQEGLEAGVFYYLTKPVDIGMLRSVLAAAVCEARQNKTLKEELGKHRTSFNLIETCRFKFRTLTEAESLAAFMANCFPDPERALSGLGGLLINAVEHGNLGIGYDRKTQLIENNIWRSEVDRLQKSEDHKNKMAEAIITHKKDGVYVAITDQGGGFDWKNFIQIDPSRAGDNHGRGIAQANTVSFDRLQYNEKGNQVVAFVKNERPLDW